MTHLTLMSKPALIDRLESVQRERDYWHRRYLDHAPATSTPMTDLREAIQILADLLNERPRP